MIRVYLPSPKPPPRRMPCRCLRPLPQGEGGKILAPGRLRLTDAGRIEELPGFGEGSWWVQDFAASLPVQLLGNVEGGCVIDLCAAPGGKTAQLAAAGARVTAVDISKVRLALVAENLARLKLQGELVVADARDWRPASPADFVLLDAPCTATGTIRRHPDIPWAKSAADLSICESLQRELLDAAAEMTAEEGTLVYAVCSLEPEEGEDTIAAFLRRRTDFTRGPYRGRGGFRFSLRLARRRSEDPALLLERKEAGMDGRYATCSSRSVTPAGPQRVGNRKIDFSGIGGQQRRCQKPVAVAFARAREHPLELRDIGVRQFVKTRIVAVERGDAVDRIRTDGRGEPAREHAAVPVEIAPPRGRISGFAGKLVQIARQIGKRGLEGGKRRRA